MTSIVVGELENDHEDTYCDKFSLSVLEHVNELFSTGHCKDAFNTLKDLLKMHQIASVMQEEDEAEWLRDNPDASFIYGRED